MFCPLEYQDTRIVLRGIVVLVVVVILGIAVTQEQLNSLTQRQEYIATVAIPYDQSGIYSFYLLGVNYDVRAVYPIGQIINGDQAVFIKAMNCTLTIPTYIEIDCKKELAELDLWAKLLVKEAVKCKQVMGLYIMMIHERINVYVSLFR